MIASSRPARQPLDEGSDGPALVFGVLDAPPGRRTIDLQTRATPPAPSGLPRRLTDAGAAQRTRTTDLPGPPAGPHPARRPERRDRRPGRGALPAARGRGGPASRWRGDGPDPGR